MNEKEMRGLNDAETDLATKNTEHLPTNTLLLHIPLWGKTHI